MELVIVIFVDFFVWLVLLCSAPVCLRGKSSEQAITNDFSLQSGLPDGFRGW